MFLLVIIAIKHNLIEFKLKGDDLPLSTAKIRTEFDIALCPKLLLFLFGRRVVPTMRGGADSLQTASYVLLEGFDMGVAKLVQCQLARSRGR